MAGALALHTPSTQKQVLPEVTTEHQASVRAVVDSVYGKAVEGDSSYVDDAKEKFVSTLWNHRRTSAIDASQSDGQELQLEQHMTVYGELGLDALINVLEAVGVKDGDSFLDIGSGDGMLVMGAAALWGRENQIGGGGGLRISRGVEILPTLYERSLRYQSNFEEEAAFKSMPMARMELYLGNAMDHSSDELAQVFQDSTLAVCFATTWSRSEPGRRLPQLSKAVGRGGVSELPVGARLVIIDGVLDESDGFVDEGQLKLYCKDTAPYSIARLYTRI